MDPRKFSDCQSSYDRIAEEYANRISGELDHKPLDRMLLDEFAARFKGAGRVCDLGCGPGHVARYLHDRGDRKSTRLNSSHTVISYAVFCLKKKKNKNTRTIKQNN